MCQIFGVSAKEKFTINDYLKKFYDHSSDHPHGWGLAIMDDKNVNIEKEPVQATLSTYMKYRIESPIKTAAAFAHIRYATIGNVKYYNCHPFTEMDKTGRQWTQVHNGTIFDFPPLDKYVMEQVGDTDSERIFMYVLDKINEAEADGPLDAKARFDLLDSLVCRMSKRNKLNYMLFDGEILYVHSNYEKGLHVMQKNGCTIVSTDPLDPKGWEPLPLNTLFGYKDGELVFTGTTHENTYVDNEEDLKFLYQIFAEL